VRSLLNWELFSSARKEHSDLRRLLLFFDKITTTTLIHMIRILETHASIDRSVKEGPKPVIEKSASPVMKANY